MPRGSNVSNKKERRPMQCENYRGVALLDVTYKILATTLSELCEYAGKKLGEYQIDLKMRASTNAIFVILKEAQVTANNKGKELLVAFLDFGQSYDLMNRRQFLNTMKELHILQNV